jgi:hypothetical protein
VRHFFLAGLCIREDGSRKLSFVYLLVVESRKNRKHTTLLNRNFRMLARMFIIFDLAISDIPKFISEEEDLGA